MFLRNLFNYLSLNPKIKAPDSPDAIPENITTGIELSNISFQYPGTEQLALKDFSATIPAGKMTVIAGPNGSGKSTIIKLLCRLYDPQAGDILLDDHNLKNFEPNAWKEQLSVVFQEALDFQDTVLANVSLGRKNEEPDPDRAKLALKEAGIDSMVEHLPDGIQSHLGKMVHRRSRVERRRMESNRTGPRCLSQLPHHSP